MPDKRPQEEKDKQGLPPQEDAWDEDEMIWDTNMVASSMECTGLIPAAPANQEEIDSYAEIYGVPQPKKDVNNGLQKEKGVNGGINHA